MSPLSNAAAVLAGLLLAGQAAAGSVDTAECRRDLFQTQGAITSSRDRLVAAVSQPQPDRCRVQRRHLDVMKKAIEVHGRCLTEPDRGRALAQDRETVREFETEVARACKGL
jgi:hypothetical protein